MPMGRPRTFDPEAVLQQAMDCFWSNGFEATSMQDLLACTGLSKSSLYESFGSKHALFEQCLTQYREQRVASMSERLAGSTSGLKFIRAMLHSVADECGPGGRRGCLVMNTATELAQRDRRVASLVAESIEAFVRVFRRAVERAQLEGEIPAGESPTRLARFIVTNMSGLRTLAKAGMAPRTLRATADVVIEALQR